VSYSIIAYGEQNSSVLFRTILCT